MDLTHDFPPFFRVYRNGNIERYIEHDFVPPSDDPITRVISKDVVISPETHASARIYLPQTAERKSKRPLLIYIHGGAFSVGSAFSSFYHNYINPLASESGYVVVSIEYRLAPEHPIPACYDDSWTVLKWVESHYPDGQGSDSWLNEFVDFNRVYLAGDSAGANIAHNMAIRASNTIGYKLGFKIEGLILVHPLFGVKGKSYKMWKFMCPGTSELGDYRLNPGADMDLLANLGCERILVCVAEKDFLRESGKSYYQTLTNSGWKGSIEYFETPGESHVFHLFDPGCEKAVLLLKHMVSFMNSQARAMSQL